MRRADEQRSVEVAEAKRISLGDPRGAHANHVPALHVAVHDAARVKLRDAVKMLGGASQIVSMIRVKCNGT